jgi:hypothetical protein
MNASNSLRPAPRADERQRSALCHLDALPGSASGWKSCIFITCAPKFSSPWTNGKIEAFWGVLQAEVLDRQAFTTLSAAELALGNFVR